MSQWTHACCERCWIRWESERGPLGDIISIRRPIMTRMSEDTPPPEICCWCGEFTIVGIYKRADPALTPCWGAIGYGPVHAD